MSIPPEPRFPLTFPALRRRRLFALLRLAPLVLAAGILVGCMVLCTGQAPGVGGGMVGLCALLLFVSPYWLTYRMIKDRTRGQPEPQPCAGPMLAVRQAAWLTEAVDGPGG